MHNQPGDAPPVFVDRTGKRRRLITIAGTAMGLGLLTSIGLILAGIFGDSTVPLPGWTDPRARPPIEAGVNAPEELGQPDNPAASSGPSPMTSTGAPTPTRTAGPSAATTARPGPQPSASVPGQGDVRRTAKPSRSPGKPH